MELKVVMIVDDDADDRLFFKEAVQELNASVTCLEATDGAQALKTLKQQQALPQYLFLDLNMPIMNGIEFLRNISIDPVLKCIPIIVYTTSVSPDDMKVTSELGARYYLPKTAEISKLPAKLQFAINMVDKVVEEAQ
jgi:CheY-like chemotaxis protein